MMSRSFIGNSIRLAGRATPSTLILHDQHIEYSMALSLVGVLTVKGSSSCSVYSCVYFRKFGAIKECVDHGSINTLAGTGQILIVP